MWYLGIVDGEYGNHFEAIQEAKCIYDLLEPLALLIIKKNEELPNENLTYTIKNTYDSKTYECKEKEVTECIENEEEN